MGFFHFLDDAAKSISNVAGSLGVHIDVKKAAEGLIPAGAQSGFQAAMNAVQSATSVITPDALNAIRNNLPAMGKQGFDMGLSLVHGANVLAPAAIAADPKALAAWSITHGMVKNDPSNRVAIVATLAADPQAKPAVAAALAQVQAQANAVDPWYKRFFRAIGLVK